MFWCLIVNVSVVNLNRYLSAGIMIFQLKKLYLILRTEIVLCWKSKIIITFFQQTNTRIWSRNFTTSKTEWSMAMRKHRKHWRKHWKVHPESLPYCILSWIIQLIRVCGSATEYLFESITKILKLDARTVSSRVDFVLFYWRWRFFNIAIIYTDEAFMWNNSF